MQFTKKLTLSKEIIRGKDIKKEFNKVKDVITLDHFTKGGYNSPFINNTIFAYDSETTNYEIGEEKKPFVFSLMLTVLNPYTHKNVNILSRSIEEYQEVIKTITDYIGTRVLKTKKLDKDGMPELDSFGQPIYDQSQNLYINIYVHNLPFDASFLIPKQSIFKMFASSAHKPYYYITWQGVRYVDTVVLTQKKLAQLGAELEHFTDKKQVGDFDYNLIRNEKTKFSEKEYGYVTNDTTVLAAFINEFMIEYEGKLCNLPLTLTGTVREFERNVMKGNNKEIKELYDDGILPKSSEAYKILLGQIKGDLKEAVTKLVGDTARNLTLTWDEYKLMKDCYAGGFTHSNPNHTGKVMRDVQSWDFTSSYPTRLLSEKFVCNSGGKVTGTDQEILDKLNNINPDKELLMFRVHFDQILSNINYDYYLSGSKCKHSEVGYIESNGRVVTAQDVSTAMLSTDWDTFKRVYKFSTPHFSDVYVFKLAYLPLGLLMSTLHFYSQKTKLKGVLGREKDYLRGKGRLNAGSYGMMVQDPIKEEVGYFNTQWHTIKPKDFTDGVKIKKIDQYNNSKNRFLFYLWGVQISAYSRHELWRGIMECKNDYCYSDTDSIKVINSDKHKAFIDKYNKEITEKIDRCLDFYGLDLELARPKDIKGKKHQLGVWDPNDGFYSYFKTLGAKRYIDVSKGSNVFEITIAGLSKKLGAKFLLDQSKIKYHDSKAGWVLDDHTKRSILRIFKKFDENLHVPSDKTGKLAHYYVNHYDAFTVTDYQGNTAKVEAGGGCLLKATDFTLSLSDQFKKFLTSIETGYYEVDAIQKDVL